MKKSFPIVIVLLVVVALSTWKFAGPSEASSGPHLVEVERGSLALYAVAVGRVEARFEVPVKSDSGGVVTAKYVKLGQWVKKGEALCEVRPVLTDRQKLQAERALLGAREAEESVVEMKKGQNLAGWATRAFQGGNQLQRMEQGVKRARTDAEKQLELLLNGSAQIDGRQIDYIVRAPIDGHVISFDVQEGQSVVPSSSYGSGTVLLTLADLGRPVFRGTVDEIDVGRLKDGLSAQVTIGARPNEVLKGTLTEISLKAKPRNNAVFFDVELSVVPPTDFVMRSGYSAVARIQVQQVTDALLLPERLIEFRKGQAFVLQAAEDGAEVEVPVEVGLGDGLLIEVLSGLNEGDTVLERTY